MGEKLLLLEEKKRIVVCLFIWVFLFLSPLSLQLNNEGDFLYVFLFLFSAYVSLCLDPPWLSLLF